VKCQLVSLHGCKLLESLHRPLRGVCLAELTLDLLGRELRAKDLERLNNFVDDLKAKEKRGFSKEQKEELACAEKVRDFVQGGTDVR